MPNFDKRDEIWGTGYGLSTLDRPRKNPLRSGAANLAVGLKATTAIRPYQEAALARMFGNGRARSGMIVLPCGAGTATQGTNENRVVRRTSLLFSRGTKNESTLNTKWTCNLFAFCDEESENIF